MKIRYLKCCGLQVTPCAAPNPRDDSKFTTDAATQKAGNDLIAEVFDAAVSIFERGDKHDKDVLKALATKDRVLTAHVHAECLSRVDAASSVVQFDK